MSEKEKVRLPLPSEVPTPSGAEGWEEMYSYYWIPNDEIHKNFLAYRDPQHFPEPFAPFDAQFPQCWQRYLTAFANRVFPTPTSTGIAGFAFQGWLYWYPIEITDPKVIEKRVPLFMKRAGYYFEHWDEMWKKWWEKEWSVIRELESLKIPELPEVEDESVVYEMRGYDSGFELQNAYRRMLTLNDLNWSYHMEGLGLGYAAQLLFFDFCRKAFPGIPDQTIMKMVLGEEWVMYRPVDELRRLAKLAVKLGVADIIKNNEKPEQILSQLDKTSNGKEFLKDFEKTKKEWFYMRAGKGIWSNFWATAWMEDLSIPFGYIKDYIIRLERGESIDRPLEEIRKERDRITEEYRSFLKTEDDRKTFDTLLRHARKTYTYLEDHMWPTEHVFMTIYYQKMREIAKNFVKYGYMKEIDDIFYLTQWEIEPALWDLCYYWSAGIQGAGTYYWPKIIEKRKKMHETLRKASAPPDFMYTAPPAITEPFTIMLFGRTTEVLKEAVTARVVKPEEVTELKGIPGSAGVAEGMARVILRPEELEQVQMGEILVCPVTNPAWAAAFGRIKAVVTDFGGAMAHAAIVAREYGIPAVLNTTIATKAIKTGDKILVDGTNGTVRKVG